MDVHRNHVSSQRYLPPFEQVLVMQFYTFNLFHYLIKDIVHCIFVFSSYLCVYCIQFVNQLVPLLNLDHQVAKSTSKGEKCRFEGMQYILLVLV
jgi:hypothetical protein